MLNSLEIQRFITYVLVGIFNTGFDFVIWYTIVKNIKDDSKLEKTIKRLKLNKYSFSQSIAFVIANFVSYFLNRYLTFFDSKAGNNTKTIGSFFIVSLFSLSISVLLMNFLTKNKFILDITAKYPLISKKWPIIAKLMVAGVTMVTNFVGYKVFVF
jgi:putative flippase GtrA